MELLQRPVDRTPRVSLSYWVAAHRRILRWASTLPDGDFMLLRFEDLVANPIAEVRRIFSFLGVDGDEAVVLAAADLVNEPRSIGRHRVHEASCFTREDLLFLEELGYDCP